MKILITSLQNKMLLNQSACKVQPQVILIVQLKPKEAFYFKGIITICISYIARMANGSTFRKGLRCGAWGSS